MALKSLKRQAIEGTIWTIAGYGTSQVLRFGGNLILTRLLVPELFGLMALVQVFITGLTLFSDVGIQPSIIRSDRGDDAVFVNTAWTIQVIRGFGLWLICLIIALPVAKFYDDSRLLWLVPILGMTTVISGLNSTSLASLNRHMEVEKLAKFEIIVKAISLVVLIVWAWLSPTIWALVGGNLFAISFKAICSHYLYPKITNRFVWDLDAIEEIISFGKWIFIATAMMFLASQADRIILGKFFSFELLGVYLVAYTFADLTRQISLKVSAQVIFPVISKQTDLPRKLLRAKIIAKRWFLLVFLVLVISVLVCFGDVVILKLYDLRYTQAAWMLPILALGLWPLVLCLTINPSLLALGKSNYIALGNFAKFIYMIIVLPLAFIETGVIGAIVAIAFNDVPYYLALNYGLYREKLNCFSQDVRATILLLSAIVIISFIRSSLGWGLSIDTMSLY